MDVVIALALMVSAAAFTARCVGQFRRVAEISDRARQACGLAGTYLESLAQCRWVNLTNKTGQTFLQTNISVDSFNFSIQCAVDSFPGTESYSNTLRQLTVDIRWLSDRGEQSLVLRKAISQYVRPP
jgi:hypothetical protein